jgi:hypothetical protein
LSECAKPCRLKSVEQTERDERFVLDVFIIERKKHKLGESKNNDAKESNIVSID